MLFAWQGTPEYIDLAVYNNGRINFVLTKTYNKVNVLNEGWYSMLRLYQ